MMMLMFFKNNRQMIGLLLFLFASFVLLAGMYVRGYRSGSLNMQAHYQQILLEQAQAQQRQQQTWLRQAEQINRDQQAWQRQNQIHTEQLKQEIQHVIAKDKANGSDCIGIGTHSLQHYNTLLGYE